MTDFSYVELPNVDYTSIMIKGGVFDGIIYHYNNISFIKEEGDELCAAFDYNIDNRHDIVGDNTHFVKTIGEILIEIVKTTIKERKLEVLDGSDGNNNSTIITNKQ